MTLNCTWWWGSSSWDLENVEYVVKSKFDDRSVDDRLIAITPRSTSIKGIVSVEAWYMVQVDLIKNYLCLSKILDDIK